MAKSEGGSSNIDVSSVTTDTNGNIFVTGEFTSATITFGSTTFTNTGVSDFFLLKYNGQGNLLWAKCVGGSTDDKGNSIAIDNNGAIFVTGFFTSPTISFGPTVLSKIAGLDVFTLKISDMQTNVVQEIKNAIKLEVFPNPSSSNITLQTNLKTNTLSVKIVNSLNQTVACLQADSLQLFTFNRGNLPIGVYFAQLFQDNELLTTKKIVFCN